MKRINSIEDEMNGITTYQMPDGRFARFDTRAIREYGLAHLMEAYGIEMPTERVPVIQHGRRVGTVPADFDLAFARSKSPFYDVRPGDLTLEGDKWIAARNLGAMDLDCLVGFQRDDEADHTKRQQEIRDETLAAFRSS